VCTHCAYHPCAIPPMCSSSAECSWECSSIGSPELQALAGFPSFTDKAEDMIECALTVPITHVPYHPCAYHPCALSPMCPITHVPYHPCALSPMCPITHCATSPMCPITHVPYHPLYHITMGGNIQTNPARGVDTFALALSGVWMRPDCSRLVCGCVQTVVVWCVDVSRL
jgi:hypothetical protein